MTKALICIIGPDTFIPGPVLYDFGDSVRFLMDYLEERWSGLEAIIAHYRT